MDDHTLNDVLPVADCDAEAARLLPWHVSGRLGAADSARVTQHLSLCATCRADLESQRELRDRLRDDGPLEYAPQAGLAATLARIDELGRELAAPGRASHGTPGRDTPAAATPAAAIPAAATMRVATRRALRWHAPQWLAAAVVVQAIGIGVLGSLLLARSDARLPAATPVAGYETLSMPAVEPPAGQVRAVFADDMTLGQLGALLAARGLQVVSGPSEAGVYTLGLAPTRSPAGAPEAAAANAVNAALLALRADRRVRFAEPTASAQAAR
jgi:hypothetical protein